MFEQKHSDLLVQFSNKFGLPDQDAEHAREWTKKLAEQFNFTFPSEGWGTKKAGPTNPPSTDVICRPEAPIALVGYDVCINAGAPNAELNPHPHGEDISNQVFIAVERVNHLGVSTGTVLSFSLFWAWAGYKKYREQLSQNVERASRELGAKCCRWFFTVGGDLFSGVDPWADVGAWYDDPNHLMICRSVMDYFKVYAIKSHLVLVGSLAQANTQAKRDAIVDRAAELINSRPDEFELVEMWNEWWANGAERAWLRDMARRLRSKIPSSVRITLSSPSSTVDDNSDSVAVLNEIESMYGGDSGASCITVHSSRPHHTWNAATVRALLDHQIDTIEGEPRGPGASNGGDVSDPNVLGADYQRDKDAGAVLYDFHSMPGVWGGHCVGTPSENKWANIFDVPNWDSIAATLKAISEGQAPVPIPPEEPVIPYDENKSIEFGTECNKVYVDNKIPQDPGMISVHSQRAAWDHYVGGMAWEDSKVKHINELRDVYGLPHI